MINLDLRDHELISALRKDGRASITSLAAELAMSRVTVQTRLDRLLASDVIRRFTVEVNEAVMNDRVRAVMMIELQGAMSRRVISRLRKVPQIVDLHSTNGAWDLVGQIEAQSLADFDQVLRTVREIEGVLNSETCLLLDKA